MRVRCLLALLVVAGCSGGEEAPAASPRAPNPTASAPQDGPVVTSAPQPNAAGSQEHDNTRSTLADRKAVLTAILGPQSLGSYQVGSAYDLGAIRMATLGRNGSPQRITVLSVAATGAGFASEALELAFRTASGDGASEHPLELLGYDLIQPKAVSTLALGEHVMPSLTYAWMRVDEDSGHRENGVGSAVWMHCGSTPGPVNGRFVLASSEMPAGKYDETRLAEFLDSLSWCGH